jgi:hypothetical protein
MSLLGLSKVIYSPRSHVTVQDRDRVLWEQGGLAAVKSCHQGLWSVISGT